MILNSQHITPEQLAGFAPDRFRSYAEEGGVNQIFGCVLKERCR